MIDAATRMARRIHCEHTRSYLLIVLTFGLFYPSIAFSQPARPQLALSTESNQTTFHIGETIPLTLSFTGPDNKQFHVNTASYDRSGRMNLETFNLSPSSGWADPLADYFRNGTFIGGGLSGIGTLSSNPTIVSINLNDWIRFDQPGIYHLAVTSGRVSTAGLPAGGSDERGSTAMPSPAVTMPTDVVRWSIS